MRQRLIPALAGLAVLVLAAVELLLADRKFGLFTGGFGQSRAVDRLSEVAVFAIGHSLAMTFAGLLGWAIVSRLNRDRGAKARLFHFVAGCGAAFVLALALRYQLHAYFSDALSFALVKQLGGGSLGDALLFGKNEIALGLGAVLAVLGGYWLTWRWLRGRLTGNAAPRRRRGLLLLAGFGFVMALWAIPPRGGDAAFGLNRTLVWNGALRLLDAATDFDRDGHGLFAITRDPAPFNGSIHPMALDVPGNGIDEDGFGGDLVLAPVPPQLPAAILPAGSPNLIVVVLESVRFDAPGKVFGGREVTPHLNALAREGSMATPTWSHVGFTTDSLKSIFSGTLDPVPGSPSLFRELKASGYRIGVISGQPEDFGDISATVAMRENADVYVDAEMLRDKRAFSFAAQGSLLVDEAHLMTEFDRHFSRPADWQRPVFLYLNFQSAHFPYYHEGMVSPLGGKPIPRGKINAANKAWLEATYWNAVAAADHWLGELVARLKRQGVWDNTLLVVTGDHGEDLFDSGFLGHGHVLNREQYGTFLVASRPGVVPPGPIGMADYRAILLGGLTGRPAPQPALAPFLQIGPLDSPTAIGTPMPDGSVASLRLDTREACMGQPQRCQALERLTGAERTAFDALIARWGSERWLRHQAETQR